MDIKHTFVDKRKSGNSDGTSDSDDPEKLKRKLQEREAQLAALALSEFEKEKQKLLDTVVDEDEKARLDAYVGENPERLETAKMFKGIPDDDYDDGSETPPPKGKVKAVEGQGTSITQNPRFQTIDELYKIREKKAENPDDVKMQAVAENKTTQLFAEIERGLKDRPRGNRYEFTVSQCQNCGQILFGRDAKIYAETGHCNVCGYSPPKPPTGGR